MQNLKQIYRNKYRHVYTNTLKCIHTVQYVFCSKLLYMLYIIAHILYIVYIMFYLLYIEKISVVGGTSMHLLLEIINMFKIR